MMGCAFGAFYSNKFHVKVSLAMSYVNCLWLIWFVNVCFNVSDFNNRNQVIKTRLTIS